MPQEWITTNEAAEMTGYHPDYIRKLLQSGKVEGQKFGPIWQVSKKSLVLYIERMDEKGSRRGPKSGR